MPHISLSLSLETVKNMNSIGKCLTERLIELMLIENLFTNCSAALMLCPRNGQQIGQPIRTQPKVIATWSAENDIRLAFCCAQLTDLFPFGHLLDFGN